jgi:hypothetical protein
MQRGEPGGRGTELYTKSRIFSPGGSGDEPGRAPAMISRGRADLLVRQ